MKITKSVKLQLVPNHKIKNMNKITKIISGLIILALLVWGGVSLFNSKRQSNNESIKIGGAFGLTGFASTWGEADRNGAILAIEKVNNNGGINGRAIEIFIEDTGSDNTKSLSAVSKLINANKVNFIIGPTWMDSFGSSAPIAQEKNIIIMTPSGAITAVKNKENYPNVFSTWHRSDIQLQKLPKYFSNNQKKKIAIIISNDSFWEDAASNFKSAIKQSDVEITGEYKINPSDTDLRTTIIKLKKLNSDVIFFGFSTEQNMIAFLKQRKEIYPDALLFTTESIEEFVKNKDLKNFLVGVNFIAPKIPKGDFYEKYKKRFGVDPIFSASNSYDAVNIILDAMRKGNLDTLSIRNYLLGNKFNTVTFGEVGFDKIGGIVGGEFVIKKITDRGVEVIKDML